MITRKQIFLPWGLIKMINSLIETIAYRRLPEFQKSEKRACTLMSCYVDVHCD